ncbi:MAG: purine-binding chemotaxis protein CheW [Chloroflexi bacterium]|nr:purine-binding chemotaxis protein CheW [Chloroflexota bacterium]
MNEKSVDTVQNHGFDWDAVRRRVTNATMAIEESIEVSPEELERVWALRAAELAQVPVEEDKGEQIRLVLIRLGNEIYGIDAQYVYYVKRVEMITHVPRVPEWVVGVVNLRGRILSVVELRRFFGLPPAQIDQDDEPDEDQVPYLVIIETPEMEIVMLVDDVLTVESVSASQIQDTIGTVRGLRPEYVQGVATCKIDDDDSEKDGFMVVVLDLKALLTDERLIIHEKIV